MLLMHLPLQSENMQIHMYVCVLCVYMYMNICIIYVYYLRDANIFQCIKYLPLSSYFTLEGPDVHLHFDILAKPCCGPRSHAPKQAIGSSI